MGTTKGNQGWFDREQGQSIYVAGTGSYAAEIADFAAAAEMEVVGLIELINADRVGTQIHGLPVVGIDAAPANDGWTVVAAGRDRLELWSRLSERGWRPATLVHPAASVSSTATIGEGCIIGPGVVIGAHTTLAEHTLVGRGALIGHHDRIGAGTVINPGANIGGNTSIGAQTAVGMGAIVVNGINVGARAVIAAGAVVVRDVGAGERVQGVPARPFDRERIAT